ncbi:MAG: DUF4252 domain-containing protein [Chlorobi bacterium]|nr:DUF4252 domain-containing protein [Chlorobiota bacterium]
MKTILRNTTLAILSILFVPFQVNAQDGAVNNLFEKYSGADGFNSVDVSKGLFQLFADIESDDEDFEELQKALDGIEKMQLLQYSLENGKQETMDNFYSDIEKSIPFKEYDELMVIKESDAKINFYSRSERGIISELMMVVNGKDEVVLMSLTGNIDLKHIAKLGSKMNLGGMEYLGKMKGDK